MAARLKKGSVATVKGGAAAALGMPPDNPTKTGW